MDAPGLTSPPVGSLLYRASATAACLRKQPGVAIVGFKSVRGTQRLGDERTELTVSFNAPPAVRTIAYASFFPSEQAAEDALGRRPTNLPVGAVYWRRNVVVEWGNAQPAYTSRFAACLRR